MLNRQRALLGLLSSMNKKGIAYSKTFIVKSLFLLGKEYGAGDSIKFYSFFPYNYGPFSYNSYQDLTFLNDNGLARNGVVAPEAGEEMMKLDQTLLTSIDEVTNRFRSNDKIREYVYGKYPTYGIRSKLLPHQKNRSAPAFFNIGYEGYDIDGFLDILIQNEINLVADVRHNPFSMNPAFIKSRLEEYLKNSGIGYVRLKALGVPKENRTNLQDYGAFFRFYSESVLAKQPAALEELIRLGKENRVAIMCFEKDVGTCHRKAISEFLEKTGHGVKAL